MSDTEFWPPPNDPAAFESLCLDLWKEIWGPESGAQKNGRSGQPQAGVDVFGRVGEKWVGIQCKQKDGLLHSKLKVAELEEEVEKAKTFLPLLSSFLVSTTGPRDEAVQERARLLTDGGFGVAVWSWPDIWHEIYRRPSLLTRIGPVYWPQLFAIWRSKQKIATSRLTHVAEDLFGRETELAQLDAAWGNPGVHVVALVAWGGVGKTSLVAKWAAGKDLGGADYFDWSFYSQGTKEQSAATGEPFVNEALRFFGGEEGEKLAASATSAWEKGTRLAEFIARRRALLVLDGLEPLQYPASSPLAGQLKDPGVEALLKGLAGNNPGLCVVTTREKIAQHLNAYRGTRFLEWTLDRLSAEAGVSLLRKLGVKGPQKELEALVEQMDGHALTLDIVGAYLHEAREGDVWKLDLVELEEANRERQNGHAFRAIATYENWLGGEKAAGERQLAVLRLLGLFDRPADHGCIAALRRDPVITGLTEPLGGITDAHWNRAVTRLADRKLLSKRDDGALDAHPLVREYFAKQLREKNGKAWRAAHSRLFEYLLRATEHRPDTLVGLQPLYQAVAHGCLAGRYQEACAGVYRFRILRGTRNDGYYSSSRLGAFGADLQAVSFFFDPPWGRVVSALAKADRTWILSEAAFRLRGLGRLTEAMEPMRAGIEGAISSKDWMNAAIYSSQLSELKLTLGLVRDAVVDAERSVEFADRSRDAFLPISIRTAHADALHQAGHLEEAEVLFREAERLQVQLLPKHHWLTSLQGFRYCDLLLGVTERVAARAKELGIGAPTGFGREEVEERAAEAIKIAERNRLLLDVALDHLTLGRVALYRSILECTAAVVAKPDIEQAVDGLRRAGQIHYLPMGLLTRSWLRFAEGDEAGARADLAEAEEIASRGPMPLYLADIALYRGRMFKDRAALAEARRLIEKHGYWRRKEELADAEAMLLPE